jgi:hypothetical protein
MTRRKPANMDFPGWVEQQIRAAEAEGAFEALPGAGRPITDLGDDSTWLANYLRRENVDVADLLPPALRLAKEVDTLDERLLAARSDPAARRLVEDLNRRIDEAYARPQVGPPLRVKKVDVDAALERRRAALAARVPPPPPPAPAPAPTRRRWWSRRRRPPH